MLDRLPAYLKTCRLLNPQFPNYEVQLTATTNKAAENFAAITGMDVITIHSYLGLRVDKDFKTNITRLIPKSSEKKQNMLLFIDEYSFVSSELLSLIFKLTERCKIVFIGDPAQLTPVGSAIVPVYAAKFPGAELTEVVRQAKMENGEENPISLLAEKFRHAVNTGEFFSFKPDGKHIIHMDRADFNQAIEAEFTRPDWRYRDSKILAWTNKCTIGFNHHIRTMAKGDPSFQVGDYAVCNSYISANRKSFKTDQLVRITGIRDNEEVFDVKGKTYELDGVARLFGPDSLADKAKAIKKARADGHLSTVRQMEEQWVDLRAAYACTVDKSQGSTFDRVYVDLSDISKCNIANQMARMLYVGCSRPRTQLFLTGDLV